MTKSKSGGDHLLPLILSEVRTLLLRLFAVVDASCTISTNGDQARWVALEFGGPIPDFGHVFLVLGEHMKKLRRSKALQTQAIFLGVTRQQKAHFTAFFDKFKTRLGSRAPIY